MKRSVLKSKSGRVFIFYLTLHLRSLLEFLLCCLCFLSGHTKFVFPSPVFFTRRVDATQNAVTFQMQIDEWAFLSCQNVSVLSFSFPLFSLFAFASGLGRSLWPSSLWPQAKHVLCASEEHYDPHYKQKSLFILLVQTSITGHITSTNIIPNKCLLVVVQASVTIVHTEHTYS